jgi:predicted site-specific integrase-resolvase
MNLAAWAERNGVARVTAYRWFRAGLLPVPARRVGRLILVDEPIGEADPRARTAVYARVSSYVQAALAAQGRERVVVDAAEVDDDLVRDMTEILTSMCARLYGKRAAENRAKRALAAAATEDAEAA